MELNNNYFFFSIKKANNCLFSRRNGYLGLLIFGYSIYFKFKQQADGKD